MNKNLLKILLSLTTIFTISLRPAQDHSWQKIDEGLYLSEFTATQKSSFADNIITVLKIDPAHYNFQLFSAKKKSEQIKTAKQWGERRKLVAAVNAGMYLDDYATNVGYMKVRDFTNNGKLNKDNTIAAFNRKDESVPEVQIIDRTCQDWEELKHKYHSFTQSIRMIDCNQQNRWSQQPKIWSMVVMGMDKKGNALLIFTRSPYSVHDFIKILLSSSLDLYNLMYLEGGPEASFYLNHNGVKREKMGSYETGFLENDSNNEFWPIPNIIGITKK